MKRIILFFSFLFIAAFSVAQKEANIWYFGANAGIDFNSYSATAIVDGAMDNLEGCSTISDKNTGELLFYTNGVTVWDSTHSIMPNGIGLSGNSSNTQVLIVPKPGSTSVYYIFTTDLQGISGDGFRYSIVDMTLNAGLGDISTKNILLHSPIVVEKAVATWHANGTDIWVIGHEFGSSNFFAYLVNSSGVAASPVMSSIGYVHIGGYDARGEMKVSADGTKVALATNGDASGLGSVQLFDFDNLTGGISNTIDLPAEDWSFGVCFSPDNSMLFVTTWVSIGSLPIYTKLYQFDLNAGTAIDIINSKVMIDSVDAYAEGTFGCTRIGPDGKIYIARGNGINYLAVINDPNTYGVGCSFVKDGFYLGGQQSRYGLNNLTITCPLPEAAFTFQDADLEVNFTNTSTNAISFYWDFGDSTIDTLQNPVHLYDSAGTYAVQLIAENECGKDTAYLDILVKFEFDDTLTSDIIIYNTFTPNNDNVNDTWHIENIDLYPNNSVEIYNRNGNLVFKENNYQNKEWDGKYNNHNFPAATYYYIIILDKNIEKITGVVTIIR